MSSPTTALKLNKTTPAAPTGQQNVVFQSDGGTPQQMVTAYDQIMIGDTGSGGSAGNVPAPAAGDAASGKFLKADGTFQVPAGGGGSVITTEGDLIVGGSGGTPQRLAAGSAGQVLSTNGATALPSWITPSGSGLTAPVDINTNTPSTVGLEVKGAVSSFVDFIQGASGGDNGSTSTVGFVSPIAVGNAIALVVYNKIGYGVSSVSDTLGNTYTLVSSTGPMFVYVALNSTGGTNTVSVVGNYGINSFLAIHEYANMASASPVDAQTTAAASSGATLTVGPITATQTDLLFTAFGCDDFSGEGTGATGFTTREWSGSGLAGVETADKAVLAGSYSAVWDSSIALVDTFYACLVALKAGPGAPQTADLAQFELYDGTVLSSVNAQGQFVLAATSGAPTNTPVAGASAFDSSTNKLWVYNGTSWVSTTLS
jgi:hypothetical protein